MFTDSPHENIARSALHLDGTYYAQITDEVLRNPGPDTSTPIVSPHPGDGNFLIEMIVRLDADQQGLLLGHQDEKAGWQLTLNTEGHLQLALRSHGNDRCASTLAQALPADEWVHLIVEVDRNLNEGITWYIDGERVASTFTGLALPRHWTLMLKYRCIWRAVRSTHP